MESNIILVVGDRFEGFANKPGVVTASKLEHMLQQKNITDIDREYVFVLGQGLNSEQMGTIYAQALSQGLEPAFAGWIEALHTPKANRTLTHKHKPENSLIGIPQQISSEHFVANLMIDDRNEIMSDHVTGQHIQGMLLIEACRQMFLAVTEQFFLSKYPQHTYYFVINDLNVNYYAFAFPLAAKINYHICESDSSNPQRQSFTVEMNVVQNEEIVTQVATRFVAFDIELLKYKEHKKGIESLSRMQVDIIEKGLMEGVINA